MTEDTQTGTIAASLCWTKECTHHTTATATFPEAKHTISFIYFHSSTRGKGIWSIQCSHFIPAKRDLVKLL